MRSGGINWIAVLVAAIVIYAIGFVIYGVMIPEDQLGAMMGITEAEKATAMSRMAFSPLMPILTAAFMAILFRLGSVGDAMTGVKWALVVAFASAIPTMLYGWVYGGDNSSVAMIDCVHLLLGHAAAGAILGGWK